MTDSSYKAKLWLQRLNYLSQQVKAEKRTIEMLEHKLYRGVSNYGEYKGQSDPTGATAAYEDALIDYSIQAERVERTQAKYLHEIEVTNRVLEQLPAKLTAIAIDRYINGIKWEKLEGIHHYCKSQLFEYNQQILEGVSKILEREQITYNTEAEILTA